MKLRNAFILSAATLGVITTAATASLAFIASASQVRHHGDVNVVIVDGAELRDGIVRDTKGKPLGSRQPADTDYRAKHTASSKAEKDEMGGRSLIVIDLP